MAFGNSSIIDMFYNSKRNVDANIEIKELTGASFDDAIGVYNETKKYKKGDIVFFNKNFYKAKKDIPARKKGDLSYAPSNFDQWVIIRIPKSFKNNFKKNESIALGKENDNNLVQIYKHYPAKHNVDLYPVSINPFNFNYYEFFAMANGYLKIKKSVKYYSKKENVYFKFKLFTDDYKTINSIDATDT